MSKKFWTGDDVKKVRNFLGLNQMSFAKRLKITQAAITGWEKNGVPEGKAARILRVFNLSADDCKTIGVPEFRAIALGEMVIFHGADLAAYRKSLKMSQGELAKRLDITQACVSIWENSENLPSEASERLARIFDGATIPVSPILNARSRNDGATFRERVKSMVDRVPDVHLPSLKIYISGLIEDGPRTN